MKNGDKDFAFPIDRGTSEYIENGYGVPDNYMGLTKLEYIATHILQGLCANSKLTQNTIDTVQIALSMAELLLRKTDKT